MGLSGWLVPSVGTRLDVVHACIILPPRVLSLLDQNIRNIYARHQQFMSGFIEQWPLHNNRQISPWFLFSHYCDVNAT